MPTYQYACTECGHVFETVQTFSDDSLTVCPECEGRLRKVFNAVGVVFKGSGFYRNDSRAASPAPSRSELVLGLRRKGSGQGAGSKSDSSSTASAHSSAPSRAPPSRLTTPPDPSDAAPAAPVDCRAAGAAFGLGSGAMNPCDPRLVAPAAAPARVLLHRRPLAALLRERPCSSGCRRARRRRRDRPGVDGHAVTCRRHRAAPATWPGPAPARARAGRRGRATRRRAWDAPSPHRCRAESRVTGCARSRRGLLRGYPGLTAVPLRVTDADVVDLLRVGDRVSFVVADPDGRGAPAALVDDVAGRGRPRDEPTRLAQRLRRGGSSWSPCRPPRPATSPPALRRRFSSRSGTASLVGHTLGPVPDRRDPDDGFKNFILRGNLVELAVAFIMGARLRHRGHRDGRPDPRASSARSAASPTSAAGSPAASRSASGSPPWSRS